MRPYELMIIHDGDLEAEEAESALADATTQIEGVGARIMKLDPWGKRRFAYEIDHKTEGYYAVIELLATGGSLDPVERSLRLADNVVRHKLIRLPDDEAERRGLFVDGEPAPAG